MISREVVITGMGINSCLGMNVTENLFSLTHSLCGIGEMTILPSHHKNTLPVGEIKYDNHALGIMTRFGPSTPRSVLLSALSIREAVLMSGISTEQVEAFIYATTVGGIDLSEIQMGRYFKDEKVDYSVFSTHDDGRSADMLTSHFEMSCRGMTISTACSSAANAILQAAEQIRRGLKEIVIAGGADALSLFTLNGFNSLMILDKSLCQPFDRDRRGLNLGEGSAFLVLESKESAQKRGAEILGIVSGWANTNDAHHQTASSETGEGAAMAMSRAIQVAELQPEDIDHINAHGTGTGNNDASEGSAILSTFTHVPPFTSTKSYTGHTLAASGALEAVFSVISLQQQMMFPTLRFHHPINENLVPVTELTPGTLKHILSNSFGFGGNCTSLIFSKFQKA